MSGREGLQEMLSEQHHKGWPLLPGGSYDRSSVVIDIAWYERLKALAASEPERAFAEDLREQVAEIVHTARLTRGGAMTQWTVALEFADRILALAANRLNEIARVIERVDDRCLAADGPVTPTLQEMTQAEIGRIYKLATGATTTEPSADRAIQAAVDAVERMGADERLTRAVILLGDARRLVSDYALAAGADR